MTRGCFITRRIAHEYRINLKLSPPIIQQIGNNLEPAMHDVNTNIASHINNLFVCFYCHCVSELQCGSQHAASQQDSQRPAWQPLCRKRPSMSISERADHSPSISFNPKLALLARSECRMLRRNLSFCSSLSSQWCTGSSGHNKAVNENTSNTKFRHAS